MAKTKNVTSSLDNIFNTSKEAMGNINEYTQMIELDKLKEFPDHPYRVIDDDSMIALSESISEYGVQEPLLVVKDEEANDNSYYIVSGHRRKRACEMLELDVVPVHVLDIDMDLAAILMVDSNNKREALLPSEKAKAYRIKYDALGRKQGQRSDLFDVISLDSLKELISSDESDRTVRRYIRLTYLNDELLSWIDECKISMKAGVVISYFNEHEQQVFADYIRNNNIYPTYEQTLFVREKKGEDELKYEMLKEIFSPENKVKKQNITLKEDNLYKFFTIGTPKEDMENTIIKLLSKWAEGKISI